MRPAAVNVEYDPQPANLRADLDDYNWQAQIRVETGRSDAAFAAAPIKIDATYITPIETHNPIELHASVAVWEGDRVTPHETSQGVVNHRVVMPRFWPACRKRSCRYALSGLWFWRQLFPWPHTAMAAVAARNLDRPVKLSLDRRMMFSSVGYRPRTEQHHQAGCKQGRQTAGATPRITSIVTSQLDDFDEGCGGSDTLPLQRCKPRSHQLQWYGAMWAHHVHAGPGAVPGLYALEAGMNELADALKIDPLQLRLLNDAERDEDKNLPFSSRTC